MFVLDDNKNTFSSMSNAHLELARADVSLCQLV